MLGLVEEGRNQARGRVTDRTQWNKVVVQNEEVYVERGAVVRGRVKIDEIPYSLATEKKLHKEQCGLCKMYFEKRSVNYKVPNHRIMDLQASWDYVRKGRRYETSSFIYAMSSVCTFCAQLFCKEDEVASSKGLPQPISPIKTAASGECEITTGNIESDDCNMITTEIKRKDVAFGQRAYQSSTVDNMSADIALSSRPSSEWDVFTVKGGSKTRREVDSWWEVDLGRTTHIDSISVVVCAAIQQPLSVYVILLNEPVGFENPFLDKITGKAVKFKQFDLAPAASPKFEKIDWKLPEMTVCVSIRVQLRGIHALCINRFQAFQGNELMEATETDLLRTANSFASLSPNAMNEGFLDIRRSLGSPKGTSGFGKTRPGTGAAGLTRMMSSSLDLLNTSSLAVGAKTKNPKISEVTKLSKQISDQYAAINAWKTRALHSVEYFTREEIFALRDVIFNVILQDMGVQGIPEPVLPNQSAVSNALTVGSGNVESGGSALVSNSLAEENEHVVNYGISDGDIVDAGLVAYAPRVPFLELSKRLRQIFRWIQGREHPKLLGPLLYSERFVAITLDPTDTLYKFNKCVQSIEKSHSSDSFIGTNANVSPGGSAGANATVGKDCSWSQFLMIMHLLCAGKSMYINKWVFPRDPFSLGDIGFDALEVENNPILLAGISPVAVHNPVSSSALNSNSSPTLTHTGFSATLPSGRPSSPGNESVLSNRSSFLKSQSGGNLTWDDILRENSIILEDSGYKRIAKIGGEHRKRQARQSFIRTKIDKLKKKFHGDHEFPATLGEAVATKHLREPKKEKVNTGYIVLPTLAKKPTAEVVDDDSFEEPEAAAVVSMDSRPNTGLIPLNSTSSRPASRAIASKSSANISSDMPLHEEHKPAVEEEPGANVEDLLKGFDKTCALCVQTFPKKSLEMKVLWKHVIALRRSWNPALVPKVITALDQSITMYNLVNVCAFCAQFFDPDFPGGIAYPQQEPAKAHPSGVVGAIIEEKKPFLKYLDTRHLDNTKSAMTRANTTNALLTQLHTSGLPHTAGNAQRLSISSANSSLCLSGISAAPESTGSGERWWEGVLGDSDCSDIEGLSFKDGESSLGGNSSGDDSRNYLRSASVLMSRARARRAVAIEKEMELQSGVLMEQR